MSKMAGKPFLLKPTGKDYLWGGSRLKEEFDKRIDMQPLAETWECSTHPDGPSFICGGEFDGMKLSEVLKLHPEFLGSHPVMGRTMTGDETNVLCENNGELPILIKFIDAKEDLSIQVHPTDEYAKAKENGQLGKSEMWYVLDASENAKLIFGLKEDVSKDVLEKAMGTEKLLSLLQKVEIEKDDVYYLEAGTIHAIGKGALIAEIQENSNLTYRLYDYDRVDKNGKKRDLHEDKALEAARLTASKEPRQPLRVLNYRPGVASEFLCRCKYFEVFRMLVNTELGQVVKYRADELSFRVLLCVDGEGEIEFGQPFGEKDEGNGGEDVGRHYEKEFSPERIVVRKGDCVFIPADSVEMTIHGKLQFLDVRG